MKSFEYHMTTDILFGMGQEAALPAKLRAYGKKILLTYGGGSIKKNGLYDKLRALLNDFEIFELGGVEPNPRVETVNRGAAKRRHRHDSCRRWRQHYRLLQSHCRRDLL